LPRKPVVPETGPVEPEKQAPSERAGEDRPESNVPSAIEVNRLAGPDPEDIGTIDAQSGGFGRDLWNETPASLVAHLMRQLPDAIPSPTVRDLLRRVMLTAAIPPVREAGNDDLNLVALRGARLQAMGLLGSASTLMEVAPNRDSDDSLLRLRAENSLMRGEIDAACADTRRQGVRLEEEHWQRLLIFCHIVEENFAEAALGASLLAEIGEPVDPLFMSLVDGVASGNRPAVDHIDAPDPLMVAMLRHAKISFPASSLDRATPPLLAMIAASPHTDLDLRLSAAERATRYGAMTAERLTSIYTSAPFSGEDLDNALSTAEAARSPRGRALLFQAATAHSVPTARAEVLQKALAIALEDGVYALSIRLFKPMLENMSPSVELSWFAADAARALYALGRADLARPWVLGLRYEAVRNPEAKLALDSLFALASLTDKPDMAEEVMGTMAAWRAAVTTLAPESAPRRSTDATALLEIQGRSIDGDGWRDRLGMYESHTARLPDQAYRAALAAAAQAGRLGETVLLASIIVGRDGPVDLELTMLAEIVGALRRVGLDEEARALVMEAAVEKGI
jgi:hypothetical protein